MADNENPFSLQVDAEDLIEALEMLEAFIDDFESYLHSCMDEPNRDSIVKAKAVVARLRGKTP